MRIADSRAATLLADLSARIGAEAVLTDGASIDARRHDYWVQSHLARRLGRLGEPPVCVVRPRRTAEVSATLSVASAHGVPVVPFGAGSGVCGGVLPPAASIVLDLSAMDRILEVNETALTVKVQAGKRGDAFERELRERGYSMGNFPQSIALSTVGGWVATRASGQFSTRYGSMEDMLVGFEAVLASGEIVRLRPAARRSTGPDLCGLVLGSEGTLAVLTELDLRIHPQPEHTRLGAYEFPDMRRGLDAARRVMRAGWRPAVLRLYDEVESARHFATHLAGGGCLLIVLCEGPRAGVEAEAVAVADLAGASGGEPRGEAPVADWLAHRNEVPSWDRLFDQGIIADTLEVTAPWDRADQIYGEVTAALRGVPGLVLASAHSSHSYLQGTCLYVTLVLRPESLAAGEALYERCWEAAMEATLAAGGSISHHHGVGRVRRRWLRAELGSAFALLPMLKAALDPKGILNPGVLL
jgi:alkyldihydroxyacetonephosphate synthase